MRPILLRAFVVGALGVAATTNSPASANTPEDVYGLGARAAAMGGTGTASSDDSSSVYYNPANLPYCEKNLIDVSILHAAFELGAEGSDTDTGAESPNDATRVTFGICSKLPYGLAFGFAFGVGMENPMTLKQSTLNSTPQYGLYGKPTEQLSIALGLGYQPARWISIGIGLSVLIHSGLNVQADIPVLVPDEELGAAINWDLQPRIAPYAGVTVSPIPELRLSAAYRGALYHQLNAPIDVKVAVSGIDLDVDLLLEAITWYSPQQVSLGASYSPFDFLTATFDLTWYQWSAYPGPFILASSRGDENSVAAALLYAPASEQKFLDIFVPRFGLEASFLDHALFVRAGYSHRPAVLGVPSERSNLLDGPANSFSVGAGYDWYITDGPADETSSESSESEGAQAKSSESADAIGEPAAVTAPTAVQATAASFKVSVDGYFRITVVSERKVDKATNPERWDTFRYGGNVWELGTTAGIGW